MLNVWVLLVCSVLVHSGNGISEDCFVPRDTGFCLVLSRRFYLDPTTRTCVRIKIGGCPERGKGFAKLEECIANCEAPEPNEKDICSLPAKTGFCLAKTKRFYYNSDTQECEPLRYGGCGGNANNFLSKQDCLRMCGLVAEPL